MSLLDKVEEARNVVHPEVSSCLFSVERGYFGKYQMRHANSRTYCLCPKLKCPLQEEDDLTPHLPACNYSEYHRQMVERIEEMRRK